MRIISQDGSVDISYDTSVITLADGIIRAICGTDVYIMAEYANAVVAEREMEAMRMTYETAGKTNKVYRFTEGYWK